MVISELRALGFSVIGIEIRATLFGLDYPELDEASGLDGDIRVELPEVKGCMGRTGRKGQFECKTCKEILILADVLPRFID